MVWPATIFPIHSFHINPDINHYTPCLRPKFCISIVSKFSREDCQSQEKLETMGAIHSTKIQTGPTGKRGPPQKVDHFFSKLFRLDRTDPLSFGPEFPEILVEWIAPNAFATLLGGKERCIMGMWKKRISSCPFLSSLACVQPPLSNFFFLREAASVHRLPFVCALPPCQYSFCVSLAYFNFRIPSGMTDQQLFHWLELTIASTVSRHKAGNWRRYSYPFSIFYFLLH